MILFNRRDTSCSQWWTQHKQKELQKYYAQEWIDFVKSKGNATCKTPHTKPIKQSLNQQ